MSLKDKVLAMKFQGLGLHWQTTEFMACDARRGLGKLDTQLPTSEITIGQIIQGYGPYTPGTHAGDGMRKFKVKLVELGLTRLDWLCLPKSTVTLEMLCGLPREQLLVSPALLLDTCSPYLFFAILQASPTGLSEKKMEKFAEMSIAKLLRFDKGLTADTKVALAYKLRNSYHFGGVVRTREALRTLGFGDSDGRFMTFGRRDVELKRLARARGLSLEQADLALTVARDEEWIPDFFG